MLNLQIPLACNSEVVYSYPKSVSFEIIYSYVVIWYSLSVHFLNF